MLSNDFAFCIAGRRGLPQAQQCSIGFIRIQQGIGKFGRLAEADRQQAGRQRVERAGMPRFFSLKQTANFLQRIVGAQFQRLIEQQYAIDGAPFTPVLRFIFRQDENRWLPPAQSIATTDCHARLRNRRQNAIAA